MNSELITHINSFWIGEDTVDPQAANERWAFWYRGGKEVDDQIRTQFQSPVDAALAGELGALDATPAGALALVILLDQFTRNLFRSTPKAYAGDALALDIAKSAVESAADRQLSMVGRIFLYHPFHHSESAVDQDQAVSLFEALATTCDPQWREHIEKHLDAVRRHADIVRQFGRFPHRNRVLGRSSTPGEVAYLEGSPDSFGQ
ncbi:MAG: DUF924 family protein [Pseudomonadota bacterium]